MQLLWSLGFALRPGSACPSRQSLLPRAVETWTAPSEVQSSFYPHTWRIALLVELAGIEPASSTHPLQPLGSVSAAIRLCSLQADEARLWILKTDPDHMKQCLRTMVRTPDNETKNRFGEALTLSPRGRLQVCSLGTPAARGRYLAVLISPQAPDSNRADCTLEGPAEAGSKNP